MIRRCRPLLGTFVEIICDREDALDSAFDAIARVHRLMSAHEPDSDLSGINRFGHGRAVVVHEWTARVLKRALYWAKESGGVFDPVKAGGAALRRHLIPRHPHQPHTEANDWTCVELQERSARLMKPACIDLGGIAKGFAVDRAVDALREAGCERGLVNAGGDLRGFGVEPWTVTIPDPVTRIDVAQVRIAEEAVATSAGLRSDDGLSFDHLGGANSRWTSVTVLAASACDADALTKLVWAGGDLAGLQLAGAKALGVTEHGAVEPILQARDLAA